MEKGFTLIELILYIALVSIILVALIPFAWNTIQAGTKSTTQQEVYSQARFITERIKFEIRKAADINSVTTTSISLKTNIPATDPTIISLQSNHIQIKQGAAAATNLSSSPITISNLTFTDYSGVGGKTKNIGIQFTAATGSTSTRQEYKDSIQIKTSVELRGL